MIYRLRKKFIEISALSVVIVLAVVFVLAAFMSARQLDSSLDTFADAISVNGGTFPEAFGPEGKNPTENKRPEGKFEMPENRNVTPEAKFTTRFFTVDFNEDGKIVNKNTEQIASVTDSEAEEYAEKVYGNGKERGWVSDFRYKQYETDCGTSVVFIDGSINRNITLTQIYSLGGIIAVTAIIIIILLVLISKKVIKPMAESYEKQRTFITDASHELKTPLTLIMANVDIIEAENGQSEWIDDICTEGENLTELVNHLVSLSRMDEENADYLHISDFSLSEICERNAQKFSSLAGEKGLALESSIASDVTVNGDGKLIGQLVSILLDNAVKYCDENGKIVFTLEKGKHPVLEVKNTYSDVDNTELGRLTERFYRADKARTSGSGYGIGLSLAESIAEANRCRLKIYKSDENQIAFMVTFGKNN